MQVSQTNSQMGCKHRLWIHVESVAISLPSEEWSPVQTRDRTPSKGQGDTLATEGSARIFTGPTLQVQPCICVSPLALLGSFPLGNLTKGRNGILCRTEHLTTQEVGKYTNNRVAVVWKEKRITFCVSVPSIIHLWQIDIADDSPYLSIYKVMTGKETDYVSVLFHHVPAWWGMEVSEDVATLRCKKNEIGSVFVGVIVVAI